MTDAARPPAAARDAHSPALSRRRLFAGASAAGAAAAVAAALPALAPEAAPVVAKPAPEAGGGYQLTAHVKRYYETTRV